ncbi:hypothetical protein N1030_01735 [Desulfovibrio mangrovi]|uniref:hypothetical protein n=1 Tax=Desulfovibrio mangrovi TaxID=2976983 RepID=UPI0022468456|nr:hypothetical protein [Desulfovibrio mangrovi]UZP67716.1 hypothetical protein N1030_01735 [Desulfovibrio mangrovi]
MPYTPVLAIIPLQGWLDCLASLVDDNGHTEALPAMKELRRSAERVAVLMLPPTWRYLKDRVDCEYLAVGEGAFAAVRAAYPDDFGGTVVAGQDEDGNEVVEPVLKEEGWA